jgi:hypothetical protein
MHADRLTDVDHRDADALGINLETVVATSRGAVVPPGLITMIVLIVGVMLAMRLL